MSYDNQNGRDRQRSDSSQPYKRKRIITKSNESERSSRSYNDSEKKPLYSSDKTFKKPENTEGRESFTRNRDSRDRDSRPDNRDFKERDSRFGRDSRDSRDTRDSRDSRDRDSRDRDFGNRERTGNSVNRDSGRPFVKKSFGSSSSSQQSDTRRPFGSGSKPSGYQSTRSAKSWSKPGSEGSSSGGKQINRPRPNTTRQPEYNFDDNIITGPVRLNKFIANTGLCSRREADEYIQAGLITVNGNLVVELGSKVLPTDEIKYNGSRMTPEKKVYILLNKPKDYVTSVDDPHAKRTVMELVNGACRERIYPVGRLDRMTTGVLLLTNDGELTKKLTHPNSEIKKIYQVHLDKNVKVDDIHAISDGLTLDDGFIKADRVNYINDDDKSLIGIEIHSGRNRIIRRIFERLGYKVVKLDRVFFGGLTKKSLSRGQWRFLDPREVGYLKMLKA